MAALLSIASPVNRQALRWLRALNVPPPPPGLAEQTSSLVGQLSRAQSPEEAWRAVAEEFAERAKVDLPFLQDPPSD